MANNKRLSEDKVDMLAAAMEDESKQAELCDRDREHLKRLKDIYAYWLDHPMKKDHYISFFAAIADEGIQFVKLYPEGNAEARFKIRRVKRLYAYCNRHGMFRLNL